MDKNEILRLDQLKPGQSCRLIDVHLTGADGQRLMDMGFIPDVEIKVLRNAPLVDPVELEIRGYNVSLRHSEARYVEVNLL
jgi:ferrous iron transport protein A